MEDFLETERTAYYRSDQQNQIGPEEKRQVDLFVKMKTKGGKERCWPNLLAVAEFKSCHKADVKDLLLQFASTVRNVFASQPTRQFVHGFTWLRKEASRGTTNNGSLMRNRLRVNLELLLSQL
ncbi:hypothetical protein E4U30_002376 [Claviceps sp. LM220 group G6]|nr:hypothetical protein E4U30_002376 [Claviceps sp. LM220 group G6]